MNKTKIFIVGGTGYLGSLLSGYLRPEFEVSTSSRAGGRGCYELDLERPETLTVLKASGASACIICAAITKPDDCYHNPVHSRLINIKNTIELFKICMSRGLWIYYFSSDHVLAGDQNYASEASKLMPISEYGYQKATVERWLSDHCDQYTILRTSKIFCSENHPGNQLTQMISALKKRQHISLAFDQVMTPVFAEDISKALSHMIDHPTRGLFHLATEKEYTRLQLGQILCQVMNLDPDLIRPVSLKQINLVEPRPLIGSLSAKKFSDHYGLKMRPVEDFMPNIRAFH